MQGGGEWGKMYGSVRLASAASDDNRRRVVSMVTTSAAVKR